jgi:hypothetical protein
MVIDRGWFLLMAYPRLCIYLVLVCNWYLKITRHNKNISITLTRIRKG